jgi:hypothetical protein
VTTREKGDLVVEKCTPVHIGYGEAPAAVTCRQDMPSTGLELGGVGAMGVLLVAVGVALRHAVRM